RALATATRAVSGPASNPDQLLSGLALGCRDLLDLAGLDPLERARDGPVGEEHPVDVVDLMLKAPGKQPLRLDANFLAGPVLALDDDAVEALDLTHIAGNR